MRKTVSLLAMALCFGCKAGSQETSNSSSIEAVAADHNEQARVDALEAGAKRANDEMRARVAAEKAGEPPASQPGLHKWIVNIGFSACPQASDWYGMTDAVMMGDMSVDLPPRCYRVNPGARIIAEDHGQREVQTYKGHEFERAQREDGVIFWSDELDKLSLSKLAD